MTRLTTVMLAIAVAASVVGLRSGRAVAEDGRPNISFDCQRV